MTRAPLALAAALWALGPAPAHGFGRGDKGSSGAQFLKLSPGARGAAMGEALSAVADDVYAIHYNPAGLANLRLVEAAGMHNSHFQGINHNFAAVAVPVLSWADTRRARDELGVMAFSLTSLSVGGIERRGLVETDAPDGTFAANDFAYTLGYGRKLSKPFAAGAALKLITMEIDSIRASGVGLDAGARWQAARYSAAGGFRNAGTKVKFRSDADPLPFMLYLGGAREFTPRWLAAADLRLPRDNSPALSLGTEYRARFGADSGGALRGGYNTAAGEAEGFGSLSLGMGLSYGKVEFDFAWVPFGNLGSTFRYSLLVRFGTK